MSETQTYIGTFVRMTCGQCHCVFGLDSVMMERLKESHATFYCPNGHPRYFPGESDKERLERELKAMTDSRDYHREQTEQEQRSKAAIRGVLTKVRTRIANGVCPCCKRSFTNIRRHIETKHPTYRKNDG